MANTQRIFEIDQRLPQVCTCISVMMQVDFDLAETAGDQMRQLINVMFSILIDRIKEGVSWRSAVCISYSFGDLRVLLTPNGNSCISNVVVDTTIVRLIVIGDRKQYVEWLTGTTA